MRRTLALVAVGLLALTAGCGALGGGSIPDDRLDQPPAEPYNWSASTDVHITVTANTTFRGVYAIPSNRSEMELYRRDGFGGRNPIPVESVRYRYPNGTVINGSQFDERGGEITRTTDEVRVRFPNATAGDARDAPPAANATAQFAFTSRSTAKRFSLPTFREGSYEVVLPPRRRVGFFLFGNVVPRGYETRVDAADRLHIRWDSVESESVVVQFYMQRDLRIFGAVVALLALIGVGGTAYYVRLIRRLRERREAIGPDVDTGDDEFGDGPPPGMG